MTNYSNKNYKTNKISNYKFTLSNYLDKGKPLDLKEITINKTKAGMRPGFLYVSKSFYSLIVFPYHFNQFFHGCALVRVVRAQNAGHRDVRIERNPGKLRIAVV